MVLCRLAKAVAVSGMLTLVAATCYAEPFKPFQPLPAQPPIPADNPQSPQKIELGKQLFFDYRLSSNGTTACVTCHNVLAGGEDGRVRSQGATGITTRRNAPSLWNVGYNTAYFRDGRAASLEEAIEQHIASEDTLGFTQSGTLSARLQRIPGYVEGFARVYGDSEPVSSVTLAKSLAAFLRTLTTPDSVFDQYLRGKKDALSAGAQRGLEKFVESGCASCHFYVNLAGPVPGLAFQMGEGFYELFPNFKGSDYDAKYKLREDIGRFQVSAIETDKHMWRVTGLRNVAVTAPYFHNGSVSTLDEAVRVMARTQLNLSFSDEEVANVVLFLNSLTGEFPLVTMPRLPPQVDGLSYTN